MSTAEFAADFYQKYASNALNIRRLEMSEDTIRGGEVSVDTSRGFLTGVYVISESDADIKVWLCDDNMWVNLGMAVPAKGWRDVTRRNNVLETPIPLCLLLKSLFKIVVEADNTWVMLTYSDTDSHVDTKTKVWLSDTLFVENGVINKLLTFESKFRDQGNIIGDKIKALEAQFAGALLDPNSPFVVRLDGHGFSKFTKNLKKPCDAAFKNAMILTTEELVQEFTAVCGYTESDEITIVFPAVANDQSTLIYKGRIQKICSLMAGYASARFNYWFRTNSGGDDLYTNKAGYAYFDARVFSTGDKDTALDAVLWRYQFDTFRNGVTAVAQEYFSHKELHKKSTGDKMRMLADKGVMLTDQDPHLLYGTFVKKQLKQVTGVDPRTGKESLVTRGIIVSKTFNLKDLPREEQIDFVFRKYW